MEGTGMKYSINPKCITVDEDNTIMVGGSYHIDMNDKDNKYCLLGRLLFTIHADEARMIVRVLSGSENTSVVDAIKYLLENWSYEQLLDLTQLEDDAYERD